MISRLLALWGRNPIAALQAGNYRDPVLLLSSLTVTSRSGGKWYRSWAIATLKTKVVSTT